MKYEAIESKSWLRDDGRTASVYGALPWTSPSEAPRWRLVSRGWTVCNPLTGEIGVGRPPCATRELAQALADSLGRPSSIGIGD
jgi:hypothetical protein